MNKKNFALNGATSFRDALDFSWLLDAPAGKHGFLKTQGDRLVFEDGTPIRFFGTNLTMGGGLPEKAAAEAIAERLAISGANMLRLHYIEGYEVDAKSTLIDYSKGNSRTLNMENLIALSF